MTPIHPMALFRLTVLGPLLNREPLAHGELKKIVRKLAEQPYAIPGSHRCYLSEKTIETWYYRYRRDHIDGLTPKPRRDRGQSKLDADLQEHLLAAKRDNPQRSLDELIRLLETDGQVAQGQLKRSSVHRLLQQHDLSGRHPKTPVTQELRSFEAEHCGDIWYGDVMHGPKVVINGRLRKAYLVSLMDDASRLIAHSAFCPNETAVEVEGVLKQALLKRGRPRKLVIDNGAAYRAKSLQAVSARLTIKLVYCKPYRPEGKAKLERWHRVVRDQFLSELTSEHLHSLTSLNSALWAWIETVYHRRPHRGLNGNTPLQRWQQELKQLRSLGPDAAHLDEIFFHRVKRRVRKDGTVSFGGQRFEVHYELSGRYIHLVVDPRALQVCRVESLEGHPLGEATPIDLIHNAHRHRQSSNPTKDGQQAATNNRLNAVDQAIEDFTARLNLTPKKDAS